VSMARAPRRESDPKKRVVITGMGVVSVFGNDVGAYYDRLLAESSGAGPIDRFDASGFPTRFAAQIRGFSYEGHIDGERHPPALRFSVWLGWGRPRGLWRQERPRRGRVRWPGRTQRLAAARKASCLPGSPLPGRPSRPLGLPPPG